MQKGQAPKDLFPPQEQAKQPGIEAEMQPKPEFMPEYRGADKLKGKVALITGGDSGIGRAVAVAFAQEGASVVIAYYDEHQDAETTKQSVEKFGQSCLTLSGDISDEAHCRRLVEETVAKFGKLDILVNNAAVQFEQPGAEDISAEQLYRTFATNIFSQFYLVRYALPHMGEGSSIINTTSVTAYRGSSHLMDYAATKGAIVSFTRSLSANLAEKKIRVNAVAPGPVWTPLIVSSFPADQVKQFGADVPMGRPAQPEEIAPCYVFLASHDGNYFTGQVLHPNGGEIING